VSDEFLTDGYTARVAAGLEPVRLSRKEVWRRYFRGSALGRIAWRTGLVPFASMLTAAAAHPRRVARDHWVLARSYREFRRSHPWLQVDPSAEAEGERMRVLVVYSGDWATQAKTVGLLVKAMQSRPVEPVVLLSYNHRWPQRFFRAFGIRSFVFWEDLASRAEADLDDVAGRLFASVRDVADLIAAKYRGVEVGRWALSSVLRQLKTSRVELEDPRVRQKAVSALRESLWAVHAAEDVLRRIDPEQVMFYEKGYTPFGELFSVSIDQGRDVIQWLHSQRSDALMLKRYTDATRSVHPSSLSPESWEKLKDLPWSTEQGEQIQEQLRTSYGSGSWFNRKFLLQDKRIKTADEVRAQLGLDSDKKTAVIFSHVLWDATFFYGTNLFRDYEQWLVETVRAACANPALNWVVKLHPDYVWKLKREHGSYDRSMLGEYLALSSQVGHLPGHVKVMDPESDISTFSLFEATDYCLTVRGTIGMEMPCFGIPVFTAGTGRYSGLGFTRDSCSREEYLEKLSRLQEFPRLTEQETALAQKHAHGVFFLRPLVFSTFELRRGAWADPSHPLSHDVQINASSMAEFLGAEDVRSFAGWAHDPSRLDFLSLQPLLATT
jgi:hypothetical protein